MLKISELTYSNSYDGQLSFDMNAAVYNETKHIIELATTSTLIVTPSGCTIAGSFRDEENIFVDESETAKLNINCGYGTVKASQLGGILPSDLKVKANVTLFRREFKGLGEFDVPKTHEDITFINEQVELGGGDLKILGGLVTRSEKDDDQDTTVTVGIGIENISTDDVQKVIVRITLFDRDDAQIESSDWAEHVPAGSSVFADPSIYSKDGRLKGAKIKVTVQVFQPIQRLSLEGNPKKAAD
jgi:hypothetical protein